MQKVRANVIWNHPLDRQGTFAEFRPLRILPDNLHRHASDWGIDFTNMTQFQSSKETKHPIKRLTVKRPSNSGFGVLNSWRSRTWRWFVCFFCGWKLRAWKRGCFTGWPCYSGQWNKIWRVNERTSCQGDEISISLQTMKAMFDLMAYSVCHLWNFSIVVVFCFLVSRLCEVWLRYCTRRFCRLGFSGQ